MKYFAVDGTQLNKKYFEKQEGKIDIKSSGRYSITKAGKTHYFAANGVELKETYFKKVENPDVIVKTNGKNYNLNKSLEKRINKVTSDLKKAEDENGLIGKAWSWAKNTGGFGDSSNKVREYQQKEKQLLAQFNSNPQRRGVIFKQLTGADYTPENLEKFIKGQILLRSECALRGYKEGQEMAVDVTADVVSGVVSFGVYTAAVAAAPFTGGASIAVGVGAAAGTGALVKTGIKYADAKSGGRKYTLKDARHDAATGAFSGALAPVTAGAGGAVGKVVTVQAGKAGLKAGAAKAVAFTAEVATDGAIGGGVDNAFRTAVDGGSAEEILDAGITGAEYGAVLGPVMGWGGKGLGKTYKVTKGVLKKADDVVPTQNLTQPVCSKSLNIVSPTTSNVLNISSPLKIKSSNPVVNMKINKVSNPEIKAKLKEWNDNYGIDLFSIGGLIRTCEDDPALIGRIDKLFKMTKVDADGNIVSKYNSAEINLLSQVLTKIPEGKLNTIIDNLSPANINKVFSENPNIDCDKLAKFFEPYKKDKSAVLQKPYTDDIYQLQYTDGNLVEFRFENGVPTETAKETIVPILNGKRAVRSYPDGRKIVSKTIYENENIKSQMKTYYDSNGNLVNSEVIKPSKNNPDFYSVYEWDRGAGKPGRRVGTVEMFGKGENSSTKISRTYETTEGISTTTTVIKGPKGEAQDYLIKDKDGNILFSQQRRYRKISENKYRTRLNDKTYDIKFHENKIEIKVTNVTGKTQVIELGSDVLDMRLIDLYKQLPGDALVAIKEMNLKVVLGGVDQNNAHFEFSDCTINISEDLKNNAQVFMHELGHAKDHIKLNSLANDAELNRVYNAEKSAYKASTTDLEGHSIDYFTINHELELNSLRETIAETQAIVSGKLNKDFYDIKMRTVVLEKYFPKTIAYIANKL